jgi:hypothetical protein
VDRIQRFPARFDQELDALIGGPSVNGRADKARKLAQHRKGFRLQMLDIGITAIDLCKAAPLT